MNIRTHKQLIIYRSNFYAVILQNVFKIRKQSCMIPIIVMHSQHTLFYLLILPPQQNFIHIVIIIPVFHLIFDLSLYLIMLIFTLVLSCLVPLATFCPNEKLLSNRHPFMKFSFCKYSQKNCEHYSDINNIFASMEPQSLKSFLQVAQDSEFPLQNIPFGVYSRKAYPNIKKPASRIGDWVIDLQVLEIDGHFDGELFSKLDRKVFQTEALNQFMSLSRPYWKQVRTTIQKLFSHDSPLKDDEERKAKVLVKVADVDLHVPAKIGDYTDFYSSRSHAYNVGCIIRNPATALNENWLHIPIGYHGRSSSIVPSGTDLRRPRGQVKAKDATSPTFSQCKRLDFEMEIGAFIGGTTNQLGKPIKVNDAWNNIFGFVLLNDWSFRDFQTWEYVPLGPFTAKNGMSTISPWIITLDALEGSQVPLSKQEPEPLPYLRQKNHISYDINLIVSYKTEKLEKPEPIVTTNYKYLYWSCAQQLSHHSVTGCNMKPGDMLGSGTISGEKKEQFGSLLELTWGGRDSITLSNGETRKFIQDGDSIIMTGFATKNGKKIGFGECAGKVLPAWPEADYY